MCISLPICDHGDVIGFQVKIQYYPTSPPPPCICTNTDVSSIRSSAIESHRANIIQHYQSLVLRKSNSWNFWVFVMYFSAIYYISLTINFISSYRKISWNMKQSIPLSIKFNMYMYILRISIDKYLIIQWWFVNLGCDNPEISLVQTKSMRTDFHVWTSGRFSNPENL